MLSAVTRALRRQSTGSILNEFKEISRKDHYKQIALLDKSLSDLSEGLMDKLYHEVVYYVEDGFSTCFSIEIAEKGLGNWDKSDSIEYRHLVEVSTEAELKKIGANLADMKEVPSSIKRDIMLGSGAQNLLKSCSENGLIMILEIRHGKLAISIESDEARWADYKTDEMEYGIILGAVLTLKNEFPDSKPKPIEYSDSPAIKYPSLSMILS